MAVLPTAPNVNSSATFFSNYPTHPDGTIRSDAPVKKHPLAPGSVAGSPIATPVAVGGSDKNTDGLATRSDTKR